MPEWYIVRFNPLYSGPLIAVCMGHLVIGGADVILNSRR